MKSCIATIGAIGVTLTSAQIKADPPIPRNTRSITVNETQEEHTTDHRGNFKHPFKNQPNDVQSIHYPESGRHSKRLHRQVGPSRHDAKIKNSRAIANRTRKSSWFQSMKDYLMPAMGTYQDPLTNYSNLNYLGEIYVGSGQEKFMVVWDTGSGAFLLESSACSGCNGDTFTIADSTSFAYKSPAEYDTTTYLDGTSLSGQVATDKICPTTGDANSCGNTAQFVALTAQNGLGDHEDGILGLWSGNVSYYMAGTISGSSDEEMFMKHMKADSDITEETFSFYMTGLDGQSYIDFGAPNTSVYTDSITWLTIESSNFWWTQQLTGFKWDSAVSGVTDTTEYAISSATEAITDTGSSCIVGPSAEADSIRNTILNTLSETFETSGWDYNFDCAAATDMPSFSFLYGGYWMQVLPEDYMIVINTSTNTCALCITSIVGYDEWILGDAFMRGWYNIHDKDNLRMGFVPFTGSSKSVPVASSSTPSAVLPTVVVNNISDLKIFGLTIDQFLAVVVVLFLFVVITCCAFLLGCGPFAVLRRFAGIKDDGSSIVKKASGVADSESGVSLIFLQ